MHIVDLIAAKRDGHAVSSDDLHELVRGYTAKDIPDYQMSAFLMAGYLRGFTHEETVALTDAMLASGDQLDLSQLSGPTVDKHSTGGVGDSTTLVVAPLAAELGMQIIKLSGRGLGFTGGTLDKLESIPGMRTQLSTGELIAQVERIGLAVCAQTDDLDPADRAMYALRDVTATVGNTALIASSIMSKKLAGGAHAILLDVKVGSGAFMKTVGDARELAEVCVALGTNAGRATRALITDMSQPLADTVGNAIEVREAIEVLSGGSPVAVRGPLPCARRPSSRPVRCRSGRRDWTDSELPRRCEAERDSTGFGGWSRPRAVTRTSSRTPRCCRWRPSFARSAPRRTGGSPRSTRQRSAGPQARLGPGGKRSALSSIPPSASPSMQRSATGSGAPR